MRLSFSAGNSKWPFFKTGGCRLVCLNEPLMHWSDLSVFLKTADIFCPCLNTVVYLVIYIMYDQVKQSDEAAINARVCESDCSYYLFTWTSGPRTSLPACNLGVRRLACCFSLHVFFCRQQKGSLCSRCYDDAVSSVAMVIKGEEKQWRCGWERLTLGIKGGQNK